MKWLVLAAALAHAPDAPPRPVCDTTKLYLRVVTGIVMRSFRPPVLSMLPAGDGGFILTFANAEDAEKTLRELENERTGYVEEVRCHQP